MCEVIFADNHILIANKPAGLLTQPDDTGSDSLEAQAKKWVKQTYHKEGNVFLHAVHRLDKPVSGLVLFAKTSKALSRLNEQMRNQEIQRVYIAEIEGVLPYKEGKLDHYLVHKEHKAVVGQKEDPEAKHARLTYEVLQTSSHTTCVRIELETGRYHQIRAQFSAIGHPVVGDFRYGAKKRVDEQIHLHCAKLSLKHPVTQEVATFESSPPF